MKSPPRSLFLVVIALLAAIGFAFMLMPGIGILVTEDKPGVVSPPDVNANLEADNPLLILPPRAGERAAISVDLVNKSDATLFVTAVTLRHGDVTRLVYLQVPDQQPVSSIEIGPRETQRLGPDEAYSIFTDYDSTVVPHTQTELVLTLQDGSSVVVPLKVVVPPSLEADEHGSETPR